jgi:hypothetical protein
MAGSTRRGWAPPKIVCHTPRGGLPRFGREPAPDRQIARIIDSWLTPTWACRGTEKQTPSQGRWRQAFTADDLDTASGFANQAAVAISWPPRRGAEPGLGPLDGVEVVRDDLEAVLSGMRLLLRVLLPRKDATVERAGQTT